MTKKFIIISCYGYLTASSVSKIVNVSRSYVCQIWGLVDFNNLKDLNSKVPKRKLNILNAINMKTIIIIAALITSMVVAAQNPINKNYSELNSLKLAKGEVYNVKSNITLEDLNPKHGKVHLRAIKADVAYIEGERYVYLLMEDKSVMVFRNGYFIAGIN